MRLNCWAVVRQCARRMRGKGRHPTVKRLHGTSPDGVRVAAKEIKSMAARRQRAATLPKDDITITPKATEAQVKYTWPGPVWHKL